MTPPVATERVFEWQRAGGAASVCVAVSLYNYARFLPECLDSVAAQTHAPLELIVPFVMRSLGAPTATRSGGPRT